MQKEQTIIPVSLGFVKSFIIKGEKTIIVDAGIKGSSDKIIKELEINGISHEDVSLIIITHAHSDHYGGLLALKNCLSAPVAVHESEAEYLRTGKSAPVVVHNPFFKLLFKLFRHSDIGRIEPEIVFDDKLDLSEYGVNGTVVLTPGHTEGSVSIIIDEGNIIVGDMIGGKADGSRASLPFIYSDIDVLKNSIRKILNFKPVRIYTSHGGIYTTENVSKLL